MSDNDKSMSMSVEILLVEDNPSDAELTLHVFKKNNISNRIQVVNNGKEALEYLFCTGIYAHRSIDDGPKVILLDLKLPLVDGKAVLKKIREDPRTRNIPVVVLTSSKEDRDIVDSYDLGVNSYIVKPVDFDQFNHAVKDIGHYWLLLNQPPLRANHGR
jgi:two-component system, response regulator